MTVTVPVTVTVKDDRGTFKVYKVLSLESREAMTIRKVGRRSCVYYTVRHPRGINDQHGREERAKRVLKQEESIKKRGTCKEETLRELKGRHEDLLSGSTKHFFIDMYLR